MFLTLIAPFSLVNRVLLFYILIYKGYYKVRSVPLCSLVVRAVYSRRPDKPGDDRTLS